MEIFLFFLLVLLLLEVALFFMSPNLSKSTFLQRADKVDTSKLSYCAYGFSSLPYINLISKMALCLIVLMIIVFGGNRSGYDILMGIYSIVCILYSLLRVVVHYPNTYIEFKGNNVVYCNGKRTTTFTIDNIDGILFEKHDKIETHHNDYFREIKFRYRYIVLCFRKKVPQCQRLTFINEFLSEHQTYTDQLEFDIFNFEHPHEIFALLSQEVYIPTY